MNPNDLYSSLQGATQHQSQRWPVVDSSTQNIGYSQQPTPQPLQQQQQRLSLSTTSFPSVSNGISYSQQQTTPQATPQNTLNHSTLSYDPSLYSLTNSQTNGTSLSNPQTTNSYYSYPSHTVPYYALASSLPISQWSSLSGATGTLTTSNTNNEHAAKASSTSTTNSMAIDPSLTSMASINPYSMQQYRLPQTSASTQTFQSHIPQQPLQQQRQQQPQQQQQHQQQAYQQLQSPQVIEPHMLVRSPVNYTNGGSTSYVTPQQIQQQHPQPTPSTLSGAVQLSPYYFMPATSYQSPQPSASTPSSSSTPQPVLVPIASILPTIRELLQPKSLDKSQAVTAKSLINHLSSTAWADIDCPTRVEILTRIRDGAGQDFYAEWARSSAGMDIMRDWLKTTVTKEGWDETLMPLLFIIERLPLRLEDLTSSKIGKVLRKVGKEASGHAAKDLASNIEAKWRKLLPQESKPSAPNPSQNINKVKLEEDARSKKRKLEGPPNKAAPPSKKPTVSSVSVTRPTVTAVKKELTVSSAKPAAKDVKTDSSFFSSKPKPKLPSFKKNAAVPKKEETAAETAQPSSIDPFQEALKSMTKGRSPLTDSKPASESTSPATDRPVTIGKNGKPKKVVTFPTDDKLVRIKFIEKAIYDDDVGGGSHHSSYRDMDIDEGHALHAHRFEEQVDWYEPIAIELTSEIEETLRRGAESTEIAAQEDREKSALMAAYMSAAQIPESPSDLYAPPSADVPPDESGMTIMLPGPEVANLEVEQPAQPAVSTLPPANTPSLQDLLAKITMPIPAGDPAVSGSSGFEPNGLAGYQNYGQPADTGEDMAWQRDPGSHQQLPPSVYGNQQDWGQLPTGQGYQEEWDNDSFPKGKRRGDGNWRGGAGRGSRGRTFQRKHCTFFQEGRCRHGDNCNFLHEYS